VDDTNKLYIDIESLLDLRQAALYYLIGDYSVLEKFLLSDEYNLRDKDEFSIVRSGDFKELYTKKEKKLLEASSLTYILSIIRSKIDNLEKRNMYLGESKPPEIVLNIYPFKLSKEELSHIQNLLFVRLSTNIHITVTSIPTTDLTPSFFSSNNFYSVFIYNFSVWGDIHLNALVQLNVTDILYYFPSVMYNDISLEEIKEIEKLGFSDIFSYTEFLLSKASTIKFLPTVFYSNFITAMKYAEDFDKNIAEEISNFREELDSESTDTTKET